MKHEGNDEAIEKNADFVHVEKETSKLTFLIFLFLALLTYIAFCCGS